MLATLNLQIKSGTATYTKQGDNFTYAEKILKAGRYSYVERNALMIDKSDFCVFYYDPKIAAQRKSGTKIAYEYALKKGGAVINLIS